MVVDFIRFGTSTDFMCLLAVGFLAVIARNNRFFPVRPHDKALTTLFWGVLLIGTLQFFWLIFIPNFGLLSFCLFPLIFFHHVCCDCLHQSATSSI
jgi:hypothetical protein